MKVQPIDFLTNRDSSRADSTKPVFKSRLRRLFDRQLPSVLRISSNEKPTGADTHSKDAAHPVDIEFEPSSVCLDKMVQNYIEDSNDKPSATAAAKGGINRCNCFNGNSNDSSDDEFDSDSVPPSAPSGDASDILKSLVPCASVVERNLLADTAKIVEQNKSCKSKADLRKNVVDSLFRLGYDASICKSRWEKSSSIPAGEYEYIDVIVTRERLLIDVEFRSEFEIARSTGTYKTLLQSLPYIFVGKADRLQQLVSIVSEAAKQSLKKKGMHIAPWRKAEYMRAKWLSPYIRTSIHSPPPEQQEPPPSPLALEKDESEIEVEKKLEESIEVEEVEIESGVLDLIFGDPKCCSSEEQREEKEEKSGEMETSKPEGIILGEEEKRSGVAVLVKSSWQPPPVKPKSCHRASKVVVTGLASLLRDKP